MPIFRKPLMPIALATAVLTLLGACSVIPEPEGPPRKETVVAVTDRGELIRFNAGQPRRITGRLLVSGLPAGDRLVGIDYRVARGVLFALSARGQLYTLDTASGQLTPVGQTPVALQGRAIGFDFNPAADRIRVVSDSGQNLRLHPDSGALASTDPMLSTALAGASAMRIAGAGYTYNPDDDKLTTNYAIDLATGALVMQGSKEGAAPVVSPNSGKLSTVGLLGTGPIDDVAFDISDIRNVALAAVRAGGRTRLHLIDLATGRATPLGTVGDGRALWGMAIEP